MNTARGFAAFPPRPGRRGRSWWARAFVAAMEDTALDAVLLRRGRRFAGSGRVGPITISPGRISAVVEDPDGIVEVTVHLTQLTDADWDRLLDQVGAEAGHLAALLDGEVPRALVHSADAVGVPLLPTIGDLESDCDCPDIGDPCQHAAALCYQTAWLLDDDPFVLLLLRGRATDELLEALGTRRTRPAEPADSAVERGVPATEAYAAVPAALPPPPPDPPRAEALVVPEAPGLPPDALPLLAADAAVRARELLTTPGVALTEWADAARWAALHPATAQRVAASAGPGIASAVRAWELAGAAGQDALERAGNDPTPEEAAAEAELLAAGAESEIRIRRGVDGRWYPFHRVDGRWWPSGPPDQNPATAL
ncbi:hypothetical protein GCM10010464_31400 [Pseudonocardia yunnanensis]|uniref:SWIM zinc finger family protein n=1 Tax=Pseudonocardia yunnanensis TaxID=58107 RepID=A0ABW4EQX5_9PSEU